MPAREGPARGESRPLRMARGDAAPTGSRASGAPPRLAAGFTIACGRPRVGLRRRADALRAAVDAARCALASAPKGALRAASPENAMTLIRDVMTRGVETISRDATLQEAAARMRALDVGVLPVCDGPALAGMVTDRDIAVRGVAEGMVPQESRVADVMTEDVRWCQDDETVEQVLEEMGEQQVRRLAVLNAAREVVGIVALGDLATRDP